MWEELHIYQLSAPKKLTGEFNWSAVLKTNYNKMYFSTTLDSFSNIQHYPPSIQAFGAGGFRCMTAKLPSTSTSSFNVDIVKVFATSFPIGITALRRTLVAALHMACLVYSSQNTNKEAFFRFIGSLNFGFLVISPLFFLMNACCWVIYHPNTFLLSNQMSRTVDKEVDCFCISVAISGLHSHCESIPLHTPKHNNQTHKHRRQEVARTNVSHCCFVSLEKWSCFHYREKNSHEQWILSGP